MKRIALWILIPLILLPLLIVGLQLLATRAINQDAIKNRIETAVSRELGGKIQYERVGLTILPRPQVVISRLSVTVPGSVIGTSESLKVAFELLPLLVGKVRLADVRLSHPDVTLLLGDAPPGQGGEGAAASDRTLPAVLGWLAATMPNLALGVDQGHVVFTRQQEPVFVLEDTAIRLAFSPAETTQVGSDATASAKPFRITGNARGVLTTSAVPKPIQLSIGAFDARPHSLSFSEIQVQALDANGTMSGRLDNYLTPRPTADFTATASIGPKAMQWIHTTASLPEELQLHAPLSIASTHVAWTPDGTARIVGSASLKPDVSIAFDVQRTPNQLSINALNVRDKDSQAAFTMELRDRVLRLSFSGHLANSTLGRVFEQQQMEVGSFKGDFRIQFALDRPRDFIAQGRLEGDHLLLPVPTRIPVIIDRFVAKATKQTVSVNPLVLTVGGIQHTVRGQITAAADQWLVDLTADDINWETIGKLFGSETTSPEHPLNAETTSPERPPKAETLPPTRATIHVTVASFTVGGRTVAPVRADIVIGPQPLHITVHEAVVCGLAVKGSATIATDTIQVSVTPSASRQKLESTLACLAGKPMSTTGTFDLSGHLNTKGTSTTLLDDLNGTTAFLVNDGHFQSESVVVKILTYLSLTDLLKGSLPKPGADGVPYKSLVIRGTAQHGRVSIDEAVLASSLAHMVARGSLDLGKQTLDVMVLVAPFNTVDAVVKRIPIVRDILGGSLMTIPVRVTGPFDNPKVDAVPPDAVAEELGGMMKRTLKLPFKIMEPVIPGAKKRREDAESSKTDSGPAPER